MRYLVLNSVLLLLTGCSSLYKSLQPATGSISDLEKFRPVFKTALYSTRVDVVGNHLSGLLIIKKMPDSSTRLVFSNEVGVKFFDFEFSKTGDFKVYSIINQMDKKPVIKTLRKDFELVLMQTLDSITMQVRRDSSSIYYSLPMEKGFYHYITNLSADSLKRMERASKRKPVMTAITGKYEGTVPDTIGITHSNVELTIGLKRIEQQ